MKKLHASDKMLVIAAGFLLLSIILMFVIIPGILNDTTPGSFPKRAMNGVIIQIAIHLALFLAYLKIIRDVSRGKKKRDGAYLAVAIILMFAGLIFMDGAFAYLSHEDMLFVSIAMFISILFDFIASILTIIVFASRPRTDNKSRLSRIPSWVLSLLTLMLLFIVLMIVNDPKSTGPGTAGIIGWVVYTILLTLACYAICRIHPKSVWYTPFICNAFGLIGLIANGIGNLVSANFGTTALEWIFIVVSIVLSVSAAHMGARKGRRNMMVHK